MTDTVIKLKWFELWLKALTWGKKRRNNQLIRVNSARERSISILQKRYGYTREKAILELDEHYPRAWLG